MSGISSIQRSVITVSLVENLNRQGSWCGETHIQKTHYFLQELLGVLTEYNYILYKHGPFSFDFRDEITTMRSNDVLTIELRPAPYGPSFKPGPNGIKLKKLLPKTLDVYKEKIEFITELFGDKKVSELERLATAFYFLEKEGHHDVEQISKTIHKIKPHISIEEAVASINEVNGIIEESKRFH